MAAFSYFQLTCRVGQDTLDDVRHFSRIGAGPQHLAKRHRSNLGVFSGGGH
jgi:hypothetical protein